MQFFCAHIDCIVTMIMVLSAAASYLPIEYMYSAAAHLWLHMVCIFVLYSVLHTPIAECILTWPMSGVHACRWIQSWATLVTAVSAYPAARARLILDFIDYPDKAGLRWEANNGLPGSGVSATWSSQLFACDILVAYVWSTCSSATSLYNSMFCITNKMAGQNGILQHM